MLFFQSIVLYLNVSINSQKQDKANIKNIILYFKDKNIYYEDNYNSLNFTFTLIFKTLGILSNKYKRLLFPKNLKFRQ